MQLPRVKCLSAFNCSQHPLEEKYQFMSPSTMKPTQICCSEGSVNQIPAWTEVKGDIRLTPFYNMEECAAKVRGYVHELNRGNSYFVLSDLVY